MIDRNLFAALTLAAGAGCVFIAPPAQAEPLPLLSVDGGFSDSWVMDALIEGEPFGFAGSRVSTTDTYTITGKRQLNIQSIRAIANTDDVPATIDPGGTVADWSAPSEVVIRQTNCGGCTVVTSGTIDLEGEGRLEIRLRAWVRGRYRWHVEDDAGTPPDLPLGPATISGRFSRDGAAGPEPSLPDTGGALSPVREFPPGVYVAEYAGDALVPIDFTWTSQGTSREVSFGVRATLAVDEVLDPPAAYDRDADGVVTADDLCLFLADPTDLTGDGVVDQSDADEFYLTLGVILGAVPDADGDGIPNACDPDFCLADLDGSGTLDTDDIDAFVTAFLSDDPAVDFDANGVLNLDDLEAFVASYLAGCA